MRRKIILIGVFLFLFFFLFVAFVEAEADCPVCPSDHPVWSIPYQACQSPAGTEWPTYVDPTYVDCGSYTCIPGEGCQTTPGEAGEYDPCAGAKGEALVSCQRCLGWYETSYTLLAENSWTALGCIPNDPRDFVAWLLARAIGIGGGIAFLLMIWGGFQVITAAGDPDRLNAGKEIISSAIAGLLLIIFSLFLLQLIGVKILEIPGFGLP